MQGSVLIVDDQEIGRITLEGFLLPLDYELHFAESGPEALSMLDEVRPDVILLDVMMPGMDGFAVCRRIRETPRWRDIPIVLVTALDDRDAKIRGLQAGADDYLSKPVDWPELRARVQTTITLGRIRRQLQERARFEWAVNQSNDGFVWLDEEGRFQGCNLVAERWLGQRDEPGGQTPWLDGVLRQFVIQPEATWAGLTQAQKDFRVTLIRPETEFMDALWLEVHVSALPPVAGESGGWIVHLQDVSALQARMQQVATLLSFVSHKLNTPLTMLKSSLDLMAEQAIEDTQMQVLVQTAKQGLSRFESVTKSLLQMLERFEHPLVAGGAPLESDDVAAVVRRVTEPYGLDFEQSCLVPSSLNALRLQANTLEDILYQLLDNAVKFHPQHSPDVCIGFRNEGPDWVRIEVEDNGPGIPPELRDRVWQPLYQFDREGAGRVVGMGVGLTLVANTVWRVGGRCWIEDGAQGGARVCILLPAAAVTGNQ